MRWMTAAILGCVMLVLVPGAGVAAGALPQEVHLVDASDLMYDNVFEPIASEVVPGQGDRVLIHGVDAHPDAVINQPTLDAIRAGGAAADTVLGRAVTNALGHLGAAPQSISVQVVGSKLDVVVVVR